MVEQTDLEKSFKLEGTVSVRLLEKDAHLLKKNINTIRKLENSRSKKGFKNYLVSRLIVLSGIYGTLKALFLSKDVAEIFDFYVINKKDMSEVILKDESNGYVSFIFIKNEQ